MYEQRAIDCPVIYLLNLSRGSIYQERIESLSIERKSDIFESRVLSIEIKYGVSLLKRRSVRDARRFAAAMHRRQCCSDETAGRNRTKKIRLRIDE